MTQVGLQFHAAPDELVSLAVEWADRNGLTAVIERFFPIWRIEPHSVDAQRGGAERIDRVALCRRTPDLGAEKAADFVIRNPDTLWVSIGTLDGGQLRESAIGGGTDDPATLNVWRSIVRNAKAGMHAGATIRNPFAQGELPYHRHTTGAHELAAEGVRMLAVAGTGEYLFTDVPPGPETHVTFAGTE
jgi:hypothetical protein